MSDTLTLFLYSSHFGLELRMHGWFHSEAQRQRSHWGLNKVFRSRKQFFVFSETSYAPVTSGWPGPLRTELWTLLKLISGVWLIRPILQQHQLFLVNNTTHSDNKSQRLLFTMAENKTQVFISLCCQRDSASKALHILLFCPAVYGQIKEVFCGWLEFGFIYTNSYTE